MTEFYNIHNFIKIKISQGKLNLVDGYNHYLRHFQITGEPFEINYEVEEFSKFILPKDYFVAGDVLGFKNGISLPREKYAIIFDGEKVREYTTYANRATNLWLQTLLLKQGLSFIHGAGVEINGKGVVFPAFGGAGKTILISELRKFDNFKFFGDDYVIVDKNRNMFSYPSDFSIYPFHLPIFSELEHSVFSRYLFRRKIFGFYYNGKRAINFIWRRLSRRGVPLLRGWNADYVKVPVVKLISDKNIGCQTKLTAAIFLSRYSGHEIHVEEIPLDQLTQFTDGILWLESQHAMPYLSVLAAFGLIDLSNFAKNQHDVLKNCFTHIKRFRILIPHEIDIESYVEYITQFIQKTLK